MSTSTGDPRPLVGHMSVGDGEAGPNAGGTAGGGERGAATCLGMGVVGVGVVILIFIGLIGGVVAVVVLSHHDATTTTSFGPGPDPGPGPVPGQPNTTTTTPYTGPPTTTTPYTGPPTTTTTTYPVEDPNCIYENDICVECNDGYDFFGTDRCFFKCHSDLAFNIVEGAKKGLTVDDTTLHWCGSNMPYHWPNTDAPVFGLRMFKAWQHGWDAESGSWLDRRTRWHEIAKYIHNSGAKVLVGTQVTCNKEDDAAEWEDVKAMMKIFGSDHIMGLAVGNELELLFQKDSVRENWVECMNTIWTDGYYLDVFHDRVRDMDSLGEEFKTIPVTSVFGGAIFAGYPFLNTPVDQDWVPIPSSGPPMSPPMTGLVLDFVNNVTIDFGYRWVWSLNIYPYFDEQATLDEDGHCSSEIQRATCFVPESGDPDDCEFTRLVKLMRERMSIENFNAARGINGRLWIGETGWSFPKADTLSTAMQWCPEFSSEKVFQKYYKAFLEWDLKMTDTMVGHGPDFVFWFTMRDSSNFNLEEHFGLMGGGEARHWCDNTTCKLQDRGFFDTTTTTPTSNTFV